MSEQKLTIRLDIPVASYGDTKGVLPDGFIKGLNAVLNCDTAQSFTVLGPYGLFCAYALRNALNDALTVLTSRNGMSARVSLLDLGNPNKILASVPSDKPISDPAKDLPKFNLQELTNRVVNAVREGHWFTHAVEISTLEDLHRRLQMWECSATRDYALEARNSVTTYDHFVKAVVDALPGVWSDHEHECVRRALQSQNAKSRFTLCAERAGQSTVEAKPSTKVYYHGLYWSDLPKSWITSSRYEAEKAAKDAFGNDPANLEDFQNDVLANLPPWSGDDRAKALAAASIEYMRRQRPDAESTAVKSAPDTEAETKATGKYLNLSDAKGIATWLTDYLTWDQNGRCPNTRTGVIGLLETALTTLMEKPDAFKEEEKPRYVIGKPIVSNENSTHGASVRGLAMSLDEFIKKAKDLLRLFPDLETITITDRAPENNAWHVEWSPGEPLRHELPPKLYCRLKGMYPATTGYDSLRKAQKALSDACLAYAQDLKNNTRT